MPLPPVAPVSCDSPSPALDGGGALEVDFELLPDDVVLDPELPSPLLSESGDSPSPALDGGEALEVDFELLPDDVVLDPELPSPLLSESGDSPSPALDGGEELFFLLPEPHPALYSPSAS